MKVISHIPTAYDPPLLDGKNWRSGGTISSLTSGPKLLFFADSSDSEALWKGKSGRARGSYIMPTNTKLETIRRAHMDADARWHPKPAQYLSNLRNRDAAIGVAKTNANTQMRASHLLISTQRERKPNSTILTPRSLSSTSKVEVLLESLHASGQFPTYRQTLSTLPLTQQIGEIQARKPRIRSPTLDDTHYLTLPSTPLNLQATSCVH